MQEQQNTEQQSTELGLKDYVTIAKRRWLLFFLIAAPVITTAVGLAFWLPPLYTSQGTLLIEGSEVPDYVVKPTVPTLPDAQVRMITDRVLTDDSLEKIVASGHLYPELAAKDPKAAAHELRQNISIKAEDPKLLQDVIGASDATVAFTISYANGSPEKAKEIASRIIQLYRQENSKAQAQIAGSNAAFLAAQAKALEKEMAAKEKELAEFKKKHANSLPELQNMNMQLLQKTQQDIQDNEADIRQLREQVALLESQLQQTSPYAVIYDDQGKPMLSPADRLKMLQRQYVEESATYSQDYPDLVKLRRQIEALSAQTGLPGVDKTVLKTELDAREQELENDRQHYGSDYPDVVRLEREVKNLRAALAKAPASSGHPSAAAPPDNPAYLDKQVQLQGAKDNLAAALKRRDDLNATLKDLEGRLTATPEVEREYTSLSRGYQQLVNQYSDLQTKQQQAEVSVNLESASKGQQFEILRYPDVPWLPSSPNRIAVLMLGLALALGGGAAGVAIAELSDDTVRSPRDVNRFLEIPPLVMIPYIDNDADLRTKRWKRLGVTAMVSAWAAVTVFFIMNPAG